MKHLHHVLFTVLFLTTLYGQQSTYYDRFKVKSSNGEEILSVKWYESGKQKIETSTFTLLGKGSEDKRTYKLDESPIGSISHSDSGFKLKSPTGELLWKVKLKPDKIEIANTEEMTSPYTIKVTPEKSKLLKEGTLLSEVKWYPDTGKLKLKSPEKVELYQVKTVQHSSSLALLSCELITFKHQAILIAELLNLER